MLCNKWHLLHSSHLDQLFNSGAQSLSRFGHKLYQPSCSTFFIYCICLHITLQLHQGLEFPWIHTAFFTNFIYYFIKSRVLFQLCSLWTNSSLMTRRVLYFLQFFKKSSFLCRNLSSCTKFIHLFSKTTQCCYSRSCHLVFFKVQIGSYFFLYQRLERFIELLAITTYFNFSACRYV